MPIRECTISVCVDCAMLIANAETPENNPEFALANHWDGWHIAMSSNSDTWFSMLSCEGCQSRLGGDRMMAHAWEETG